MSDQAQALRDRIRSQHAGHARVTKVVTIASGKGGVGKSNFTLNFALALQSIGLKVLVFDADTGLANIDVLMGVSPKYTLYHLLKRQKTIWEIIYKGQQDLQFISGGSGFSDLLTLTDEELEYFTSQINELNGYVDYILFDTGAGLTKAGLKFILSAQETIVITTPEPTAITDAYAIIKMVHAKDPAVRFQLVVNRVGDTKEGVRTAEKITLVAKQFLALDVQPLGFIADDANVAKAVKRQVPFMVAYPNSSASRTIAELAKRYAAGQEAHDPVKSGMKGFLHKMIRLLQ